MLLLLFLFSYLKGQLPINQLRLSCHNHIGNSDLPFSSDLANVTGECSIARLPGVHVSPQYIITLRYMGLRLDLSEGTHFHESISDTPYSVGVLLSQSVHWRSQIPSTLSERKYRFVFGIPNSPWIWNMTGAGRKSLMLESIFGVQAFGLLVRRFQRHACFTSTP